METAGARSREILRYRRDPHRRDPQAAHLPPIMLLYNTVHQPNGTVWTVTRGALLGESPPASFPFDGSESASAISAVSPSVRPRISQSRVTPGNLRTIRTAISLLSGAPHSTLLHLPRSTPRKLANSCWSPRPLKPIASRKRRARFDVITAWELANHDLTPHDKIRAALAFGWNATSGHG